MKRHLYLTISIMLLTAVFTFCTPYSSDKMNMQMIQGRWMLVDTRHATKKLDTVYIDYNKQQTFIVFNKDTFTQYMPYLNDTVTLTFNIHEYMLSLNNDSVRSNTFSIVSLTADSLILKNKNSIRKYKKTEQQ
ncbi:hypothetical protein M2451_000117 [Dysgonomonas sp. PFB1-18]|uniref:lipocalin family protein n=1 Tax=unclassified Dysgonomonas TaxID=2630389 RepID=UPI0024731B09|nr:MULTISPECIES: lipocalin family protein [unclassified Dysgonomonas]MDH6307668.1 hypothetical protein [Dysgonomonas sp. PF1-14]MDH6337586.1 hypothetical protein [Dysgonomonas sp. PF1-16]MDH6378810.1 hypothetical protein [Dysgonomonas sp. PFB1-18]MDH6396445.1 hypothetical protein [Dysgonomonas sp. PF1-23]